MAKFKVLNFNSNRGSLFWQLLCQNHWLSFALSSALIALGLIACTHAPTQPQVTCANIDWFEMGRSDGTYGLPFAKIQDHQARCNHTPHPVDFDVYTNGRNLGLIEYCTAAVGAQVAKEERPYEGVCPDHMEQQFLAGYELGRRINALEKEHATVASRMEELSNKLNNGTRSNSPGPLRGELEQLRQRRTQIDTEIDKLESQSL